MNRFFSLRPFALVLAAVGVIALSAPAQAEERPHISRGTAQFVSPTGDFVGAGNATHLGKYSEIGNASISGTDPTALQLTGWATYTAADGDELCAVFDGQLNALTGEITATLTYMGGTGRFTDASGSAALSGQLFPDGSIAVAVNGTIDY